MKNAYLTFLSTDSYIYYILGLYESWKETQSQYPLYVCVTANVSQKTLDILKHIGCPFILLDTKELESFNKKNTTKKMCEKYRNAFGKLAIFSLTFFDKCIYLDSDLIIKKNIDDLFNKPDFSAVEDCLPVHKREQQYKLGASSFNSGMFVFTPNKVFYRRILSALRLLPHNIKWHDQAVLAFFNKNWMQQKKLHLPYVYNTIVSMQVDVINHILKKYKTLDDIKVFHYVTYKDAPYTEPAFLKSNVYQYYYDYFSYINSVIKKYNLSLELIHLENVLRQD